MLLCVKERRRQTKTDDLCKGNTFLKRYKCWLRHRKVFCSNDVTSIAIYTLDYTVYTVETKKHFIIYYSYHFNN